MRKIFDYDDFMDTVDDCDVCAIVDEITNWMDELDLDDIQDGAVYRTLENVMDIIVDSCTYR